jgi:hypothetical protein
MVKLFSLMLLVLSSCVENHSTPEGALKDYIENRIQNKLSREEILQRLTGKLKLSLENLSDEEFQKFTGLENLNKNSVKILNRSCNNDVCYLTYTMSYKTTSDNNTFEAEVKKIAELRVVDNKWLIADVSNVKTYLESLSTINVSN